MSIDKISKGIAGCINNHRGVQKVLEKVGDNPAVFSSVASFGLASILRPATLDVLPFKNDGDRKCSKASAITSGLVDLVTTILVFIPLSKGIDKASKLLNNSKGTIYFNNKNVLEQFKSITNRSFKLLLLVPINMIRMSLIKPLMDKMGDKKGNEGRLNKWG